MVYKELVEATARRSSLTIAECRVALDTMFEVIKERMMEEDNVYIKNFGSFSVRETKEHIGVNPYTQKRKTYPSSRRVVFHASNKFREQIR